MGMEITPDDLRDSFNRCPLLRLMGISFTKAQADPLICAGLRLAAKGRAKNARQRGERRPEQPTLLLEPTP